MGFGALVVCLVAATLGFATGSLRAQGLPRGDASWIEVKTAHFTVVSDARGALAVEAAENLERFYSLLESLRQRGANQPLPTLVFGFRNAASFETYNPWPSRDDVAGFFLPGRYRNYLGLDMSPREEPSGTLYHEYVHQFIADNFPEVPLWFNEGLAEYYSNFEVDRGDALVGRPIVEHLEWLRADGLMPMAQLLAVTHESKVYNESDRAGIFYAQSWATVHYLLSDSTRAAQVVRYLETLGTGKPVEAAFQEAFGRDFAALERELSRYVASRRFAYARVPLAAAEAAPEVAPLAKARALALLGDFVANFVPPRVDQAASHFDAALALDAAQPLALAGRGLLREHEGDLDGALAQYQRAASAAPSDPHPSLLLGLAGVDQLQRLGMPEVPTPEQQRLARTSRAALERVLDLSPGLGLAQAALGLTYLWDGDPQTGIAVLLEARRSSPSRPDLYLGLAVLTARTGAFDDAWRVAEALERVEASKPAVLAEPELAEYTQLAVAALQLQRAGHLVNEGQEQAALDLVTALDPRLEGLAATGEKDARELVAHAAELRAFVKRRVIVRELQAAANLASERQLASALVEVERILARGIDDDDLRGRAEELRRSILRVLGRDP